jgi:methanogenic corrinoid protein MtbC1
VRKIPEKTLSKEMEKLAGLVAELKEDDVQALLKRHIEAGTPPAELLAACQEGMRLVGHLHEDGQYFIAALIMAGEIMRQAVDLLRPMMIKERSGENLGRVLLGTIEGDIHDIGKNLFRDLLECLGFTVLDLGVDVSPAEFLRAEEEFKPHLIAASVLITDSFPQLQKLVKLLKERACASQVRPLILIGGGQVDEVVFHVTGSDYWASDAFSGVWLCEKLVRELFPVRTSEEP